MHTHDPIIFPPEQTALFGMLGRSLFQRDYTPPADTDWQAVLQEAYAQTVVSTAFCNAVGCGIPDPVMSEIKAATRGCIMRIAAIQKAHTILHSLLTANGIPYVILKGAASAYYYPNSLMRGMGDVDFFIPPAYREAAMSLLLEQGFTETEGNERLHTVLAFRGVKFELHYDLPGVPDGEAGERIRRLYPDLTEQAEPTTNDAAVFMRPSHLHHGLILLLHTQAHLLSEGLGLRHVCDWAVFAHRMGEGFRATMEAPLRALGLWRFARILSLAGTVAAGLPESDWMGEDPTDRETAAALLQDVLEGGNFGYKDKDRSRVYESRLSGNSHHGDTEQSRLKNGFSAVNDWVRDKWPAARKCPLLLPLGWIYFLLRRLFLVVTGKKKPILVKETLENSRKRQSLYRRFALFKPDPPTNSPHP